MILIAGIPDESPVELAIQAAEDHGVGFELFDQRQHADCELRLELDSWSGWRGTLIRPQGPLDLTGLTGVYVRLMDHRFLPGMPESAPDDPERLRSERFHGLLNAWLDIAPGRIANRPRAMLSNMSKSFQALLIRDAGLSIPESLITNDPDEVLDFVAHCRRHGDEVIYKSVSGTRSIVQTFHDEDRARLERIRWCPTQFQRKVRGTDVRVHVIGSRVFATRIESEATDYRYARRQSGEDAELAATELPATVASACVSLAAILDLPFTGIDMRQTPAGDYVCFEANPCPAYSYYESRTGAPIARELMLWLACQEGR